MASILRTISVIKTKKNTFVAIIFTYYTIYTISELLCFFK